MEKSWIVYGPQGSGKTLHKIAIAKALGLRYIVDEWNGQPNTYMPFNTLHLAIDRPFWARDSRRTMSIGDALVKVRQQQPSGERA